MTNNHTPAVKNTEEQPAVKNIIPELKGTDPKWDWMTPEQKQTAFTAPHRGITDDDIREAWNKCGSTAGTAKLLECSATNARNRLRKLGIIEAGSGKSAGKRTGKPTARPARKPGEAEAAQVAAIVGEQIMAIMADELREPTPEEKLQARIAELEAKLAAAKSE